MAKQVIDLVTVQPNGKPGETVKSAFTKVNGNFTEVYNSLAGLKSGANTDVGTAAGQIPLNSHLLSAARRNAIGAGDVYARGGVVGYCSQSAGVPTGAVIERGNNSNGHYIRYACGTQICWQRDLLVGPSNTQGNRYQSWAYPIAFADKPAIIISKKTSPTATGAGAGCGSEPTSASVQVVVDVVIAGAGPIPVSVFAFGRWY